MTIFACSIFCRYSTLSSSVISSSNDLLEDELDEPPDDELEDDEPPDDELDEDEPPEVVVFEEELPDAVVFEEEPPDIVEL